MELILKLPYARAQLFGLELTSLGALLHVQDAHHTGEVDALVGELVDEFEALDVGLAPFSFSSATLSLRAGNLN